MKYWDQGIWIVNSLSVSALVAIRIMHYITKFTAKRCDSYMISKNTLGVKKWCCQEKLLQQVKGLMWVGMCILCQNNFGNNRMEKELRIIPE